MSDEVGATATESKVCPDCAETVQGAARVCKHCGYRFDHGAAVASSPAQRAPAPPQLPHKSTAGAVVLGLVLAGLGHFYLGENRRGAVLLAGQIVLVVGAGIAGVLGAVSGAGGGLIVALISAVDAYVGAQHRVTHRRLRPVTGGVWAFFAVCIVVASLEVALGVNAGEEELDGPTNDQFRLEQYDRCVADGILPVEECGSIYLEP